MMVFFIPVRIKDNSNKNYQNQCSTAKKNIQTEFIHLPSSSSTIYAAMNVTIQNINPPTKTPVLKPREEINCPTTNPANVSFPTAYNAFDKLVH